MATAKPRAKRSGAVAAARRKQKQPPWLWIGVGALVVVLGLAAVLSGGGDDKKSAEGIEETRPVSVTGAALPEFPRSGADPAVGQTIPEVKGQAFDGSPVEITSDGRAKVILFVAHWCPHCQKEIPLLADYLESNSLPAGVDLYTVSTGVARNRPEYPPSRWLEKEGWNEPTVADSGDQETARAFGLSAFPYFVAADASGKVVARTTGELSTDQFVDLANLALGNR